ncbi:hypothetical protein [Flavihumibacter profundi]|uniref:hypothetical protein n=1 Tax=Flavihumibacter profundi TaxID=2716883 RepID=UPI001CC4548E|nr:hypothetical protein [Flavihumibacter profundi]MBZ5857738.1 hypothetical protein [Flavihumibacter profundi]
MTLKNIFPFESYTLESKLSVEEIKRRISENLDPKKTPQFSFVRNESTKPYRGNISNDSFEIIRIINYRNSFLPTISGNINGFLGKTQIRIKMRPSIVIIVFMSLWLGLVGLICLFILIGGLLQAKQITQNGFSFGLLIPFIMFLFGWLLILFGFKSESKKSKEFLSTLLEGQKTYNQ